MANLVEQYLKNHGPSLSSEITESLVKYHNLSAVAARQRVSRGSKEIYRLDLSFPRRAKFLYLKQQSGSELSWTRLELALLNSHSAYGYAISALRARGGVIPKSHFEIVCGSPIKQKKHLSASVVLNQMIRLKLLYEVYVEDIGTCVYLGLHINHLDSLIPAMKARLFVEELTLRGIYSWMRKLGFASYTQIKARTPEENPRVSTTAWDLAGPSYLSPLVSFKSGSTNPTPGFVVCDILLTQVVTEKDIDPFIKKLSSLRSLRNVGKQLSFFVANSYDQNAFKKLKALGVSPATTATIFDNEIGRGMTLLIELLAQVVSSSVPMESIDQIFKSVGKIDGASNRLRGALFEFVIADAMRLSYGNHVQLNKECKTDKGKKEADVISITSQQIRFIEGKGYNLNKRVTLDEVKYWLDEQVPVFRAYALAHPDWQDAELVFEFWTTSSFEPDALNRLEKSKEITKKYQIEFKDHRGVTEHIAKTKSKSLISTYKEHFVNAPVVVLPS